MKAKLWRGKVKHNFSQGKLINFTVAIRDVDSFDLVERGVTLRTVVVIIILAAGLNVLLLMDHALLLPLILLKLID